MTARNSENSLFLDRAYILFSGCLPRRFIGVPTLRRNGLWISIMLTNPGNLSIPMGKPRDWY